MVHTSLDLYHQEAISEKVKRLTSDYGLKCQIFFTILEGAPNVILAKAKFKRSEIDTQKKTKIFENLKFL